MYTVKCDIEKPNVLIQENFTSRPENVNAIFFQAFRWHCDIATALRFHLKYKYFENSLLRSYSKVKQAFFIVVQALSLEFGSLVVLTVRVKKPGSVFLR